MRKLAATLISLTVVGALLPSARAQLPLEPIRSGSVYALVTPTEVTLGNPLVERVWDRAAFTSTMTDKRGRSVTWSTDQNDFSLEIGNQKLGSDIFSVASATVESIGGGLRVTMELAAPGLTATRIAEAYNGIAGFRTQTILHTSVPLILSGATLDEAQVPEATPTIHAFRAGADWREPGWSGPQLSLGDKHAGTWRDTHTAAAGEDLAGPAQWVSTTKDGRTLFMVMERNDYPSSRAGYEDSIENLRVDFSRDVLPIGPFEEQGHIENPGAPTGRHHAVLPGSYALPAGFTGFGRDADDEPWQFYKYLSERRLVPYAHDVTFNSNGTDANVISTGAKDDMNFEKVQQVAPIAKALGIDTFILDDGWQAISGDWFPDCPDHPEPRWDGDPDSKFRPRFPDCNFQAVRDEIAPMKLGLWMNVMHFNHNSETYKAHPEWACAPVGHALNVANAAEPDSGSNEAGLGTWGPDAIPHVESRIRVAITEWQVRYFKFDFLVWLDCAGQGDIYDYKDRFTAMLDRLQEDFPNVTFEIDETNDYRLFPFDSVTRGPSWFQNGSPQPPHLLHNLWNLAPFVPGYSLGQHFLGGGQLNDYPVDTLMATALTSHLTYFSDLTPLADKPEVVERVRTWTDFYRANVDLFAQMTYPLLDDPIANDWTALQTWNPEEGRGGLLAFRQESSEPTKTIALRNVPSGRTFDLLSGPDGTLIGTVSSEELSSGLEVTLDSVRTAAVILIVPASPAAPAPL